MSQRGFTLIETMIVVVIIGISLTVAMPAFGVYRRTLLTQQAREQLLKDLRAARQMAITQRTPVIVAFGDGVVTSGITSYKVHADRNGDRVYQATEPRVTKQLPSGAVLAQVSLSPVDTVWFDISGVLRPGTSGGQLISATSNGHPDTLLVSLAGVVYRQ